MLRRPAGLPIRWRLAAICAGLTLIILVCFSLVLGNVVGDRFRADFEKELKGAAGALAHETQVGRDPISGMVVESPSLPDFAMAEDAVITVADPLGRPLASSDRDVKLGAPRAEIFRSGGLSVATEPIRSPSGGVAGFVQYARPNEDVDASVERLWLFLAAGVLAGTLIAAFGGLAVASRAMRPIASLTSLARDITTTRDPSRRMPVGGPDDEVGELARTMDEMLEALDDARGEREAALERQREFVADASHELRTPLTSVQANLELLQASGDGPDDRETLASALASAKRMGRLVGDLSLLARAESGQRSGRTELDLADVSEAALAEVEPLAGTRTIQVDLRGPLPVSGNRDQLHQVAVNLLQNAVRHTPGDSSVFLCARRDGDLALLEVTDDGPGLPAGQEQQVFERFVRGGGPADVAARGGSGLGLAIVKAVIDAHGGSVEAGKAPVGGARFTVRLPLVARSASGPSGPALSSGGAAANRRVS